MSLSFTQINASLCTPTGTPYSLRTMSAAAGFSTPDLVSEFSGYVCPTVYQLNISCDGTTNALACGLNTVCTAYCTVQTPVFGTVFYANVGLTALYDFSAYTGGLFIKVNSYDGLTGDWSCRMNYATSSGNNTPQSCP
jgi:hypothetical protein